MTRILLVDPSRDLEAKARAANGAANPSPCLRADQSLDRRTHDNELRDFLSYELDDGVPLLRGLRPLLRNVGNAVNSVRQVSRSGPHVRQMIGRIVLREPDAFGLTVAHIE